VTAGDVANLPVSQSPSGPAPLRRNRDYLLLFSGQTVSGVGNNVSQIAFPLLVLALTRSPAQAGLVGALRVLPYLALSLPAGALVDRWDRKRTMIACDTGRALAMGSIPLALWAGHLAIVQLYVVSLVEGTLFVFFSLALTASVPRVVTVDQLPAAMANNEISYNLAALLGPFLGGFLYGLGRLVPFLLDAVSYTGSVFSLFFVRREFQEKRKQPSRRLRSEMLEGFSWLWGQPLVRTIGFLSAVAWIMLSAMDLVVIVLARQQHAPPSVIGLIFALGGLGGMAGSLVVPYLQRRVSFGQLIISSAWVWCALWPLFAIAPNPGVLAVIMAGLFVVWPVYNVTQMSYRLALIPDQLQGRVNSVFRLISFTGQPLGFALAGELLQLVGPKPAVLLILLAPLSLAVGATLSRHVRQARPLAELQKTRSALQ
jgi:MFS family permease